MSEEINELKDFLYNENILTEKPKNNPTDYERFFELQSDIDKKMEKVNKERIISERKRNLAKWENSLPARWRDATLNKINSTSSNLVIQKIKQYRNGSYYFKGEPGSGKTYLAYATLRRLIGSGITTPSRIKIVGEDTILGYSKEGFRGRDAYNKLFDPIYNVYLFDNIGNQEVYDEKEIALLEQLIDHVYSNSLMAIFTSTIPAARFAKILSGSTSSKLSFLIEDRNIKVEGKKTPIISDFDEHDDLLSQFDG